jgi:hypothetical protein
MVYSNRNRMPSHKTQVIYKLEGINAEDGVDIFDIAPILMHFGELVKVSSAALGLEQKVDVKIKPFREGSWITDFILQHKDSVTGLFHYLKGSDGQDFLILMQLLGLSAKDGITGLAGIIRFTHGKVSNFIKNNDGETVTYVSPTGEKMKVSMPEHRLVQSPLVQNNYYHCVVVPFDKFPTASAVKFETPENSSEQTFTEKDKPFFEEYARTELLEDVEENVSMLNGVYLKPKRGSYAGEEKAYSFVMGENNVLWPVTIDDEAFIRRLSAGDLRLYSEDVLKVELEIRQKKDATNRVLTTYSIKKVLEYTRYEKPKQLGIQDLIDKE